MMKKSTGVTCSTPEYHSRSPLRDSDSEGASPVPFLCTQDGAEGINEVIWNYYTPTSKHATESRVKNSTPLTTKKKRMIIPKRIQRSEQKRRTKKVLQEKPDYIKELHELNQNLYSLIEKNAKNCALSEKQQPFSDEDIFDETQEYSPKSGPRMNSNTLRKNLLNSNLNNSEPETIIESDDSINECLFKASQVVEECIKKGELTSIAKKNSDTKTLNNKIKNTSLMNMEINNDSMDAIINSIKLDSPLIRKVKKCNSPCLNNDSFDSLVGNLNDSIIDRLTQIPSKNEESLKKSHIISTKETDWTVAELIVHDGSSSSKTLIRHSSMPESPLIKNDKPSTSGMAFGRYNTMPHNNNEKSTSNSPIKCTPEEIRKKHQQAKEKLLAKRQLPFTSQSSHITNTTKISHDIATKKPKFEPKVPSSFKETNSLSASNNHKNANSNNNINCFDQKLIIEKKRQEALMKLRSRQPHRMLT